MWLVFLLRHRLLGARCLGQVLELGLFGVGVFLLLLFALVVTVRFSRLNPSFVVFAMRNLVGSMDLSFDVVFRKMVW
jgi:hypothetical protein